MINVNRRVLAGPAINQLPQSRPNATATAAGAAGAAGAGAGASAVRRNACLSLRWPQLELARRYVLCTLRQ